VGVNLSHPGNLTYGSNRLPLFLIDFIREPYNEINDRDDPGIMAEFRCPDRVRNRVATVQPGEDGIASGLGTKM
jgi:hypothetical protein